MSKNYKGGYKIIDLQNIALLSGGTIKGIYAKIEASYRKAILLSGIVISGVEKNDVMTKPEVVGTSFVFRDIYGYDVTIEDDDTISVASTQWATRAYVDEKAGVTVLSGLGNEKISKYLPLGSYSKFIVFTLGGPASVTGHLIKSENDTLSGIVSVNGKTMIISYQNLTNDLQFDQLSGDEIAIVS